MQSSGLFRDRSWNVNRLRLELAKPLGRTPRPFWGHERHFGDVCCKSVHHLIADMTRHTAIGRNGPNGDIHFAAKNASTHRQPGGAKSCGIGLDPCRVAANELGLEPSADREIRTCRH